MSLKSRKEADSRYMWDLSHIFESREAYEKAYSEAEASLSQIAELRGRMTENAETLKKSLDTLFIMQITGEWILTPPRIPRKEGTARERIQRKENPL